MRDAKRHVHAASYALSKARFSAFTVAMSQNCQRGKRPHAAAKVAARAFFPLAALVLLFVFAATCAQAKVRLPSVFADHLVLQRDAAVTVWGLADAGEDKKWIEADASIDGDSVIISSAQLPKPVAVRYGWANSPRCNLYNREGLPASPFRTDDWPPGISK